MVNEEAPTKKGKVEALAVVSAEFESGILSKNRIELKENLSLIVRGKRVDLKMFVSDSAFEASKGYTDDSSEFGVKTGLFVVRV